MSEKEYNLLYVDDEEANLRIFKSSFKRNYNIFIAIGGEEGLKILKENKIDLILTDQRMPKMTGTEFLKLTKEDNPNITKIIITGFSDFDAIRDAINDVGIFQYVEKPWDPQSLKRVIDNALEIAFLRDLEIKNQEKIKMLNQNLEQKVIDRTKKLKEAYVEISSSEKKFKAFIEHTLVGFLNADLQGKVLFVNDQLVQIIEAESAEEVYKKQALEIKDSTKNLGQFLIDFVKDNPVNTAEINVETYSQKAKTLILSAIKVDENIFTSIIDITERKEMEKELEVAKYMADAANEAKSKFLANMSHEIRSPLNAIVGFSHILMNQLKTIDAPDKFKEYFHNIEISGKNLSGIINDILDLSKIEAGKMSLSVEDVNIEQLIKSIYHINKDLANNKGVTFKYDFIGDIPKIIKADRTKLNQILVNLISNAVKFTPAGKEILLKLVVNDAQDQMKISVKDTGIGIPANRIEKIFEPFEQADNTTTRKYGGTGLGLTITKKMTKLMEGKLTATSKEGVGSEFTVTVPLVISDASELYETELDFDNYVFSKDNKILVVEDNPLNREMMTALFDEFKLKIEIAENGIEGIKKIGDLMPNLVLMDIHMPLMDGIQATKEIRKNKKYDHIPIVAVSADAFKENQKKALSVGFDDYLTKPVDLHKMMPILAKHLKSETKQQPQKAKTKRKELPVKVKKEIDAELKEILEIPIYQTEQLINKLESIKKLSKGYTIPWDLQSIESAIYSGNSDKLNDILKSVEYHSAK